MSRITLEHQEDKITFPVDSLLLLRIDEAIVKEQSNRAGTSTWEKLNIKFYIQQIIAIGGAGSDPASIAPFQNWIGEYIYGSARYYLSDKPDNQLRNWLEAIFQADNLPVGFEFDPNMIVGRQCKGVTSQYDATATDQNGVPYKRHQVNDLLKAGGMAVGQPQAQYQQPAAQQGWGGAPQGQPVAQQGWGAPPAQPQYQQPQPQGQEQTYAQQQHAQYAQAQAPLSPSQDPWSTPGVTGQEPQQQIQYAPQPAQQAPQGPQTLPNGQVVPAPAVDPWAGTEDWQEPGF